uniref:Microfibril associated protein 4 n=2 Tax=Salarias fasciatus TaxID=181472 RepID=A0A672GSB8_SALFA
MNLLFQLLLVILLKSLLTNGNNNFHPLDCQDIYEHYKNRPSAVYTIYPSDIWNPVKVYCDMKTDGGTWTVIQRRMDGSINFYRPWDQYKRGFGNAEGEYWLGLDNIHNLTRKKKYELYVDMMDFTGRKVHARYTTFSVGPGCVKYTLKVSGFTDGGAGDSLTYHNNRNFSTFDKDSDSDSNNCAKDLRAAFWYRDCYQTNPNGIYAWGPQLDGVVWHTWKGSDYSLKAFSMKIRREAE